MRSYPEELAAQIIDYWLLYAEFAGRIKRRLVSMKPVFQSQEIKGATERYLLDLHNIFEIVVLGSAPLMTVIWRTRRYTDIS